MRPTRPLHAMHFWPRDGQSARHLLECSLKSRRSATGRNRLSFPRPGAGLSPHRREHLVDFSARLVVRSQRTRLGEIAARSGLVPLLRISNAEIEICLEEIGMGAQDFFVLDDGHIRIAA